MFYVEFQHLLEADKNDDLGRMYNLVHSIPEALVQLRSILESHIVTQGLVAIDRCGEAAVSVRIYICICVH